MFMPRISLCNHFSQFVNSTSSARLRFSPHCLSPSSPYKPIYPLLYFFISLDSSGSMLYRHVWFQFLCRFISTTLSLNLSETSNFHFKVSFLSIPNYLSLLFLSLIGSTRSLHQHLSFPPSFFVRPSVFNLLRTPTPCHPQTHRFCLEKHPVNRIRRESAAESRLPCSSTALMESRRAEVGNTELFIEIRGSTEEYKRIGNTKEKMLNILYFQLLKFFSFTAFYHLTGEGK